MHIYETFTKFCAFFLFIFNSLNAQGLNFLSISDSVHILSTEITNIEHENFLHATRNFDNPQTRIYQEEWGKIEDPFTAYERFYTTLVPKHPVVNISQEGAKAYCRWLTNEYNNNAITNFKKIEIRLPTKEEWELAASIYNREITYFDSLYQIKMYEPDSTMAANGWSYEGIEPKEL